jgi:hypothetical protein
MSKVAITGNASGTGTFTIASPNSNSDRTLNLPDSSGTLATLGTTLTRATAVTASGTAVDFTGIPSWAKRITVMFSGVSTNGISLPSVQLGAGSVVTTGYTAQTTLIYGTNLTAVTTYAAGFPIYSNLAADALFGGITLSLVTPNLWVVTSGVVGISGRTGTSFTTGSLSLSGVLDRVRITTVNGTDAFDAGTINIMYEG